MKIKKPKHIPFILKSLLFLSLAVAVAALMPDTGKLNYKFEKGKSWVYDALAAPFDFPIYKTDKEVERESAELLKNFTPYFSVDTVVFNENYSRLSHRLEDTPIDLQIYLLSAFERIYSIGIIAPDEKNDLLKNEKKLIYCIFPNREARRVAVENFYTPKTAYESIIANLSLDSTENIADYDLNYFLTENVLYDTLASNAAKNEILKNLSLTSGMIAKGDIIIEKGETVTPEKYSIITSLKKEYAKHKVGTQQSYIVLAGDAILIFAFILLLFLYMYVFRQNIFSSFKNLLLIVLIMLVIIGIAAMIIRYTSISYFIVPFALLPFVIRVFFDSRTALFVHFITVILVSLMVDNQFQFMILQIAAGMATVSNLKDLTQRSQLVQTAFYVLLCYFVLYLGLEFVAEGSFADIHWKPLIFMTLSCIIVMLSAHILVFFIEKIFGLISSVTLVELTNLNRDFMIRFAESAPGTFQHSLQVSNLATEAAKAIRANALLVRTGALYHDIGKMQHPEYFTENQHNEANPLSSMDFTAAAQLIIAHVTDGITLGKKQHLPNQIINFIATHHGTGKTKYFYNAAVNAGVVSDEQAFTYPGPRPNSKETAILMMADAVEARSRSLKEYSEESIDFMVEDMIDSQIADGQFKDAPISFLDVERVKAVFKEKIKNIYHTRISYPTIQR